jgi:hypothetical protein
MCIIGHSAGYRPEHGGRRAGARVTENLLRRAVGAVLAGPCLAAFDAEGRRGNCGNRANLENADKLAIGCVPAFLAETCANPRKPSGAGHPFGETPGSSRGSAKNARNAKNQKTSEKPAPKGITAEMPESAGNARNSPAALPARLTLRTTPRRASLAVS